MTFPEEMDIDVREEMLPADNSLGNRSIAAGPEPHRPSRATRSASSQALGQSAGCSDWSDRPDRSAAPSPEPREPDTYSLCDWLAALPTEPSSQELEPLPSTSLNMTTKAMASHSGPPQTAEASAGNPSPTLYITNICDKLPKNDVRKSLYALFSTYGPVLDVVALKTRQMRGQAHVVFRDAQTSTQAMRALQGFDFYGKELKIQYAKKQSDVFTKLDGVYRPPTAPQAVMTTELQQSIFNAPPSGASAGLLAVPPAIPAGPKADEEMPHGTKRTRDEVEAPAEEEDDDDDVSMEASSDED